MIAVTFIIPAYNAEKYLDKCLSSFCEKVHDVPFEVIVVNDGSTDGTQNTALKYVKSHPEIFRVIDKENGGHGSGINVAAAEAQGKYLKVVDADDWVTDLDRYLAVVSVSNSDVIINEFCCVNMVSGKNTAHRFECEAPKKPIGMENFMAYYPKIRDCCSFHGITYKTGMFLGVGHRLSEKVFYEDQEFSTLYFVNASLIELQPFVFYCYLVGNGEQSIAARNQAKHIGHIRTVLENCIDFWDERAPLLPATEEYFRQKLAIVTASYFSTALIKNPDKKAGRQQAEEMANLLEKKKPILLDYTAKKRKTMLLMNKVNMSPELYQHLLDSRLYRRVRDLWRKL